MYFISHKSDAADTFAKFLSDLRLKGIPSEVVVIRSDDRGEFKLLSWPDSVFLPDRHCGQKR